MAVVLTRLQAGILCGWLCCWVAAMDIDAFDEHPSKGQSITGTQSFQLTPGEREQLERQAETGDPAAAFRLAQYYYYTERGNFAETRDWLEKARTGAYAEGDDDLLSRIALRRNIEALEMTLEGAPITGAQFFNLTLKEREQLERKAAGGNAAAAMRLSQYYGLSLESNVEHEMVWLRKAAELV